MRKAFYFFQSSVARLTRQSIFWRPFFPDPLIKKDIETFFTYAYTNIKIYTILILEVPELATIAVLPDHPTPCAHRTHTAEPVPFLIYRPGIEPDGVQTFDEVACQQGAYGTLEKDEFIRTLLA